jgi:pyruvate-formate lyase-activating enzyme
MTANRELRAIQRTLKEIPFPSRFAVELCADCNLACSMCHHPQMRRPKGVMPFELWRRCADEIARVSPRTQVWFSFCGEPLLAPELLLRMLAYGREVGLRSMHINTNGMLLTPDLDGPILSSGVQSIVFGVDGFTRKTFERIRIGADRDTVYGNVERLLGARAALGEGPEIMVQLIEMDENADELHAFRVHWLARGATLKIRNKLSWGGSVGESPCLPDEERIPCPWAMTMMHVLWDGRVPRCPGDTEGEEGVGNAWHASLVDLWRQLGGNRDLHMRRAFDALPPRCRACTDWQVGAAHRVRPRPADGGRDRRTDR